MFYNNNFQFLKDIIYQSETIEKILPWKIAYESMWKRMVTGFCGTTHLSSPLYWQNLEAAAEIRGSTESGKWTPQKVTLKRALDNADEGLGLSFCWWWPKFSKHRMFHFFWLNAWKNLHLWRGDSAGKNEAAICVLSFLKTPQLSRLLTSTQRNTGARVLLQHCASNFEPGVRRRWHGINCLTLWPAPCHCCCRPGPTVGLCFRPQCQFVN